MLSDKIYDCIKLIDEVQTSKDQNDNNKKVSQKNNIFFDAYKIYFRPLMSSYNAVKQLKEFKFSSKLIKQLSDIIETTKKILEEKYIVNPSVYKSSLYYLNNEFAVEWKNILEVYDAELVGGLAILKPLQTSKEITQILYALNSFRYWPVEKSMVQLYKLAREKGDNLLLVMQFDAEIRSFLQRVSERKATLSDLTEKVIAWIKNEHLEDKFGISVFSLGT